MKTEVKIVGLDCPNCAKALEGEICKLESVKTAKLDFLKETLVFESENTSAIEQIIKLTANLEPSAKIITSENQKQKQKKQFNQVLFWDCTLLSFGIVLAVILLCLKTLPLWTFWTLYVASALLLGWKTYYKALRLLLRGIVNENLLVTISVIGASFVSQHLEGLMVIALYSIGKIFEGLAINKSRKSIEKLAKLQPEFAVILQKDGTEKLCKPEEVAIGSILIVKAGEKVAIDGIVVKGLSNLDMQSLSGESVPVSIKEGEEILSGSIVLDGVLHIRTTKTSVNSAISKIMTLVENATQNKSKTETFISKLTKWYTLAIVALAVIVWGIVWIVTKSFDDAIYRALIFLVISCPCAFAISIPLSYFSGLGNASKHGILIKGSNHLDTCSRLNTLAFDKTGTLTTGNFEIKKISAFNKAKTKDQILYLCALGEQNSLHPLAKAIKFACKSPLQEVDEVKELAGQGIQFCFKNKVYFVGKKADEDKNIFKKSKQTCVYLYEDNILIGEIVLKDCPKPTSKKTCSALKEMKIKTALISGDNSLLVKEVAKEIGIDIAIGQLLPDEKYAWIEKNKNKKNCVGYVGDGINDAPSLALADVGFSMGINGSPASIEASDIVLVDDDPQKVVSAIKISKFTKKIVLENIMLSAGIKVIFLALGSFGITGMLAAVFADVGVTLLAIFNSLRALKFNPNKHHHLKIKTTKLK